MRRTIYSLAVAVAIGGLLTLSLPGAADHANRSDVRNLEAVADLPNTDTLANSDMAFWGNRAFQGHWEGWQVHDISNPRNPKTIVDYVHCNDPTLGLGGGQGDIIVWDDLLVRAWNSGASAEAYCGTDPNGDPIPIAREGFEGVHVFDISDVGSPQLVASVDIDDAAAQKPPGITTGCGAHTLTAVPDPSNGNLIIYVGGSNQACPGMDLVRVPLANPAAAEWYGRAVNPSGRACHDITVYMGDRLRAVCSGSTANNVSGLHGFSYWSMGAAGGGSLEQPVLFYERNVSRVNNQTVGPPGGAGAGTGENGATLGHTTSFSQDGKILLWSTEPGGGVQAQCQETDADENREMYFFSAELGQMKGLWRIPTQSAQESCASIHIMQSIPTRNGLNVMTSGTYMAGTYLVDFTDPVTPKTLGWSDPPADAPVATPADAILGGAWATYWYNGYLYESNIKKGLFIHRSTSPEAQTPVRLPYLNPQTVTPADLVRCKGEAVTIVGTDGNDRLVGTRGVDIIGGSRGKDRIKGLGGRDLLCGGGGKDRVRGGGGGDLLFGQGGADRLNGGGGPDQCVGGGGRDRARKCEQEKGVER